MIKLHLGCGPQILEGWINIDNTEYPGVDRVLDVTAGLPYNNDASFIFAEHFVEHLSYTEAAAMLRECRRVLLDDGVLRLSTPNLDWVWASHYKHTLTPEEEIQGCFALNGAFRAWGHKFLYNFGTLRATLLDAVSELLSDSSMGKASTTNSEASSATSATRISKDSLTF